MKNLQESIKKSKKTKKYKSVDPSLSVERKYNNALKVLVKLIANKINNKVLKKVKRLKPQYLADSWQSDISKEFDAIETLFATEEMTRRFKLLAERMVREQSTLTTTELKRSINKTVGVDLSHMFTDDKFRAMFESSIDTNFSLIKSLKDDLLSKSRTQILSDMNKGLHPSSIAKNLNKKYGISKRRARLIARDQVSKINSDTSRFRMKQTGASLFRWVVSGNQKTGDGRVGKDHLKAANRLTRYGKGVYTLEKGAPEGFPGNANRPNCRCTMELLIPNVNYFPKK